MSEIIEQYIKQIVNEQERIIKETAEQGYKYLIIKKEQMFQNNTMTCKYKYHGINSDIGYETLKQQGYEIYELDKVREYLNSMSAVKEVL
jgi:serine protease inhibitor ecotin